MIMARLGRESTLMKNGVYVKDLSYLNRDMKDVIYIDFDTNKCVFQPNNVLVLPRWEGEMDDRELYDILPFLESLGQMHGSDARKELDKYGRVNTGKKFLDIQSARRDMILKQRNQGIGGVFSGLGKLQKPGQSGLQPRVRPDDYSRKD